MDKIYTLMLADDDEDDRMFFTEALEETHKATLITAKDGVELMYRLQNLEHLPDAIFLDLNMPCMDGHECLKQIKKDKKFRHIPIVIYSTSKSPVHIDRTYTEGASLYITKPQTFPKLRKMMHDIFTLECDLYKPQPPKEKYVFSF